MNLMKVTVEELLIFTQSVNLSFRKLSNYQIPSQGCKPVSSEIVPSEKKNDMRSNQTRTDASQRY